MPKEPEKAPDKAEPSKEPAKEAVKDPAKDAGCPALGPVGRILVVRTCDRTSVVMEVVAATSCHRQFPCSMKRSRQEDTGGADGQHRSGVSVPQ